MKQTIFKNPGLMKRFVLALAASLAFAGAVVAQQLNYINYGTIDTPQVDATNFDNEGIFTATNPMRFVNLLPYETSDTVNYTNHNTMIGNPGFDFETVPSSLGQPQEAANFVNGNIIPGIPSDASIFGSAIVEAWATNLVNRGLLQTADTGVLSVHGGTVDVAGGGFLVNPFGPATGGDGMVSLFWGNTNAGKVMLVDQPSMIEGLGFVLVGTNYVPTNIPQLYFTPLNFSSTLAVGLPVLVTNLSETLTPSNSVGTNLLAFMAPPPFLSAEWYGQVVNLFGVPTNWMAQAVFITTNNNGPGITTTFTNYDFSVAAPVSFGQIVVSWATPATNAFGKITTNMLFLSDKLAMNPTNNIVNPTNGLTNSYGGEIGWPAYQMKNFTVSRGPLAGLLPVAGVPFVPYTLSGTNSPITNFVLSSYAVDLLPFDFNPNQGPEATITNDYGRVEIVADDNLDLNNTRIDSASYTVIRTRHLVSYTNFVVSSPYTDLYLGSTNGTLAVANVALPTISRLVGYINAYSMFWSNQTYLPYSDPAVAYLGTNGTTPTNAFPSDFNVVMVDSHLTNTVSSFIDTLSLTCTNTGNTNPATYNTYLGTTNIAVPEVYNIQTAVAFNTPNLTIEPSITLNLLMVPPIDWEEVANVQSFTNQGVISSPTGPGLYFIASNPNYSGQPYPPYAPYLSFVNSNSIAAPGIVVAANFCRNTGTLTASNGAVEIDAGTAQLSGGKIISATSDASINCGTLIATNAAITVGRSLSLSITNSVQAGANTWSVNDGFNLYTAPASGDLRAVAVSNSAPPNATVLNYWAAPDLGPTGFAAANSCVLGHLVLTGSTNSAYWFIGQNSQCGNNLAVSNALYVDRLDLNGTAGVTNVSGLADVVICSGMKIYFNSVYINGTLANTTLNGKNGGALVNATDSSPGKVFNVSPGGGVTPSSIGLTVVPTVSGSAAGVALTWNTVPGATNNLYYKNQLGGATWQVLTNFVSGSSGGTVTVNDPASANGRFYQVRLDVPQQ
jgi:hypothetical protein